MKHAAPSEKIVTPAYVVVTPARNELSWVRRTAASMASQTLLPLQWTIVDDGSTDGTSAFLDELAAETDWISVIHRRDRGYRAAGGGVIEAFCAGYELVAAKRWHFIVKLDADLSFGADYFERCLGEFANDEKLGIGGGTVCRAAHGRLVVDSPGDPPFHVRGATKIYRRECWERISPLVKAPGWDTIDEVKANYHGWRTRTFAHIELVQLKPTGSADGSWRNWFKNGRANYLTGYHPMFMLAKCVRRALGRPLRVESLALAAGYWSGCLKRMPRALDDQIIHYLRDQQVRRLLSRPSIYR